MKKESKQRTYKQLREDILSDLTDPRHGHSLVVLWSYGCKCEKCESLRQQIKTEVLTNPLHELHGNRRCYVYCGCRCSKCISVFAQKDYQYQREYNWKRIGIKDFTWKNFTDMIANQNNKCALCKKPIDENDEVEHCHATGKIRGIVHHRCNQIISLIDNRINIKSVEPELIVKAVNYIVKNGKV